MPRIEQRRAIDTGQQAEKCALNFLLKKGLSHWQSNFHCRQGEIDLVMRDVDEWVFVEVKYRKNSHHGQAAEYFHGAKRRKFTLAVKHFMHQQRLNPAMVSHRIDLVAIDGDHIQWFTHI